MKPLILVLCTLSAVGCTTSMETRPGRPDKPVAVVGAPYALPKARHELTVTRTLVKCETDASGAVSMLEFEAKVTHVPRYVPGERFVVDYRSMGAWHKTSAFKLETNPNQTLKSINAEAEDRSPDILGTTVKTALTLASLSGSGGASALMSPTLSSNMMAEIQRVPMNKSYADRLRQMVKAQTLPIVPTCPTEVASLAKTTAALKDKSEELLAAVRKLDEAVIPGLIGLATDEQKQEVRELVKKVDELRKQQAALQKQQDALAGRLGFSETLVIEPRAGSKYQGDVQAFPSSEPALAKVQTTKLRTLFGLGERDIPRDLLDLIQRTATLSASLEVMPGDSVDICGAAGLAIGCAGYKQPDWGQSAPRAIPGVAYRHPAQARLRVCKSGTVVECASGGAQPALLDLTVSVPQLGDLVILPFQNGFGENNSISAVFREDGSLDWLGYGVKETAGENLADLLGDSSEQWAAYREERREQQEEAREAARAAPLAALDDQIALLTRQRDLAQLVAANDEGAISQQMELSRLQAEIARLSALRQIMDLEAALEGGGAP